MSVEIRKLHKRFGTRQVLCGVDLTIAPSEVVVILGQNGSGKSTLLRLVAGILEPDSGKIFISGNSVEGGGVLARRQIGYVPDTSDPLPDLLVAELCALVCSLKQAPAPSASLIEQIGVASYFHQRLGTLSFGQRKRACLLCAMIGEPALLVLDEPSNGIDPDGLVMILSVIAAHLQRGGAAIVSTNDAPFAAALAGRQLRLQDGVLIGVSGPAT